MFPTTKRNKQRKGILTISSLYKELGLAPSFRQPSTAPRNSGKSTVALRFVLLRLPSSLSTNVSIQPLVEFIAPTIVRTRTWKNEGQESGLLKSHGSPVFVVAID